MGDANLGRDDFFRGKIEEAKDELRKIFDYLYEKEGRLDKWRKFVQFFFQVVIPAKIVAPLALRSGVPSGTRDIGYQNLPVWL